MTRLTLVMVLLSVTAQCCLGLETGLRGEPKRRSAHLAGAANAAPDHIKESPTFAHMDAAASTEQGYLEPRMMPLPVVAQPSPPEGLMPPPVANTVVLAAKPAAKTAEAKAVHTAETKPAAKKAEAKAVHTAQTKPAAKKAEAKAVHTAAIQIWQVPGHIGTQNMMTPDDPTCRCQFRGICSCEQALEFMNCISDVCASGACECQRDEFVQAGHLVNGQCPKSGLKINETAASCPNAVVPKEEPAMDILGNLKEMRDRKCELEQHLRDGWINAKLLLSKLQPKIEGRLGDLQANKYVDKVPTMGCTLQDLQAFDAYSQALVEEIAKKKKKEEEARKKLEEGLRRAKEWREKRDQWGKDTGTSPPTGPLVVTTIAGLEGGLMSTLLTTGPPGAAPPPVAPVAATGGRHKYSVPIVYLFAVLAFGYFYYLDRKKSKDKRMFAPRLSKKGVEPVSEPRTRWRYDLMMNPCFDEKLTAIACCCSAVRMADTVESAKVGCGLNYWVWLLVFLGLIVLDPFTYGLSGLAIFILAVYFRQKQRQEYNIVSGGTSIIYDCLVWMFCAPCAIVQEAREQAHQ